MITRKSGKSVISDCPGTYNSIINQFPEQADNLSYNFDNRHRPP